jgi:single-stranded-DNA-specific exonuclease
LSSYGGHAGAAGFAIETERIPQLRAALSRAIAAQVEVIPEPALNIDAYVNLGDLTLDLVGELNRLAPFGPGNPPLTLAVRDLRILSDATIGRMDEHRRVTVEAKDGQTQTVFWWHGIGWSLPRGRFDLALSLRASDYRGMPEVQIEWLHARALEPEAAEVESAPAIEVLDCRAASHPEALLQEFLSGGDVQVWAEGQAPAAIAPRSRLELAPGRRLAIWTSPPGPRELQAVLEAVQPDKVLLFVQDPDMDDDQAFLTRLAGLVKFALRDREGQVDLEKAAAATAQRSSAVQAGLLWLAAQGQIVIVGRGDDRWQVTAGHGSPDPGAAQRERSRLKALLAETAAYREYVRQAPAGSLAKPL